MKSHGRRAGAKPAFFRDEDGTVSLYGIYISVAMIGIAGYAIDSNNAFQVQSNLRTATEAAALAAIDELGNPQAGVEAALSYAALNADPQSHGAAVTAEDVDFGNWNGFTRTFTINGFPSNAVRVSARRTTERGNAVGYDLMRLLGTGSYNVTADSIAVGLANCAGGGLFSVGAAEVWNSNEFYSGFCLYSDTSVTLGNTNIFPYGSNIVLPDTTQFWQGIGNLGASQALLQGERDLDVLAQVDTVTAQMQDGALPAYLPDWITRGPVYLSRIKPRTPLQPNTFYRVSGHVSLGANRDLTDIAIAATGNIETGSNVDMKNVFLTAYGDISFNSNNDFGETDYCNGGTYDIHLFARGNISFGSNNRMRGMLMAAKGDITMLNNLAGLSSVHAEAGGITYLKNASEMDSCAAALQSPFLEDPTDKFTVVKLVK